MLETLHYQSYGRSDSNAPCLVLIHGLFGSGDNLSMIRRHFEQDYRVISLDLPDHGQSPWSSAFSFEDYAQQVILTLSSLGIEKANIVGHSLGGKVAMYVTYLKPELVQKLVVVDIAPVSYEPRHNNVLDGLTSVDLSKIDSRKAAQASLEEFVEDAGTQAFLLKSLYQDAAQWKWRFNVDLIVREYLSMAHWPLEDVEIFSGDVLFIKGIKSNYITEKHQSRILKQFPNAKAKMVDAGHWLHAEKPSIVNKLITEHLQDQ
ncbi:alpha/beta fold hydrolase [Glaciecola sp. 2405UD65-10]|jgi:esterase|uniref:alpha/beta fold hydrolase n=1 Tax=Glaciecola sp. 2405UD65-10 TaxID=3397244 RepID=UPI003B5C112D